MMSTRARKNRPSNFVLFVTDFAEEIILTRYYRMSEKKQTNHCQVSPHCGSSVIDWLRALRYISIQTGEGWFHSLAKTPLSHTSESNRSSPQSPFVQPVYVLSLVEWRDYAMICSGKRLGNHRIRKDYWCSTVALVDREESHVLPSPASGSVALADRGRFGCFHLNHYNNNIALYYAHDPKFPSAILITYLN